MHNTITNIPKHISTIKSNKFRFKNETIFAFHTLKMPFSCEQAFFRQIQSHATFCVLFSIDYLEGLGVELLLESYIFVHQTVKIFHFRLWDSLCHNHFKGVNWRVHNSGVKRDIFGNQKGNLWFIQSSGGFYRFPQDIKPIWNKQTEWLTYYPKILSSKNIIHKINT